MGKSLINFLIKSKFNVKQALKNYKFYSSIKDSGLFNEEFYGQNYGEIKGDLLTHYLFKGYKEGNFPSLSFDSDIYSEVYDIDLNPLLHYIAHGKNEGKIFQTALPVREKERILKTNMAFLSNYKFSEEPLISIIILNRNGLDHLQRLFKDFELKTNYSNYEIIVVDNASTDESINYLNSLDLPIKIIENKENVSFSKGNNDACKIAKGEYILLLNNDIEPTYGWLNEIVGTMVYNNESVGAVGAKLVFPFYPNDKEKSFKIQHTGDIFAERMAPCCAYAINNSNSDLNIFDVNLTRNSECIAVTGAAVLINKEIYKKLGGLDENYIYGLEDVDFCLKLHKHGFKTILSGNALLFHHESSTRIKNDDYIKNDKHNYEVFNDKWGKYLSKEMLIDKIDNKHFFTEKKLKITIISERINNFITDIGKEFNNKNYNVELISDLENNYVGNSSDILLSFSNGYDLTKLRARKDIVKIFVVKDDNVMDNINNYDILVVDNDEDYKKLKDNENNVLLIENDFSNELLNNLKSMDFYEY